MLSSQSFDALPDPSGELYAYALTDVHRITYLFTGRPYRRIVVETQEPGR
ncbi:MAG: hypothetical protein AB1428_07020 [Bacteroidota bacterium]